MEKQEDNKIEFSEPMGMMAILTAVVCDLSSIVLMIALSIPGIGLIFFFFGMGMHYVGVFVVGFLLWGKFRGVLTKVLVVLLWIVPLPTVSFGILIGRLFSNKFIRMIAEQVVIQAVAVATGGAGEALEGVVAARGAAAGAQAAARGVQAGAQVAGRAAVAGEQAAARGAQVAQRAAQTGEEVAEQKTSTGLRGKIKEGVEKKLKTKPEELLEKTFEKMEEMSEEEDKEPVSSEVVDLSSREEGER